MVVKFENNDNIFCNSIANFSQIKRNHFSYNVKDNLLIHRFDKGLILKDCEILKLIQMTLLIIKNIRSFLRIYLLLKQTKCWNEMGRLTKGVIHRCMK